MCLIVFAWSPDHSQPLVVAANRDEFHARPSLPLGCWEDAPWIIGGRDLQAGGTWMGVTARGRFAALTNIRAPGQPIGAPFAGHTDEVNAVAIGTLDGTPIVVSGGDDRTIRVWDLDQAPGTGQRHRIPTNNSVLAVAMSPDGVVVAGTETGIIAIRLLTDR